MAVTQNRWSRAFMFGVVVACGSMLASCSTGSISGGRSTTGATEGEEHIVPETAGNPDPAVEPHPFDGQWRITPGEEQIIPETAGNTLPAMGFQELWFEISESHVVNWTWAASVPFLNEGPELHSSTATLSGNTFLLSWSWIVLVDDSKYYQHKFAFTGAPQPDGTILGTFTYHYSDNFLLFDRGNERYDAAMVRR